MNSEEDLICLHCKGNFTHDNPPRMLTMCGHTFCDTCIKAMIVKKKINNKFKLICPEDKNSIDLNSNNPSFFPKNIALMKILETKAKNKEDKMRNGLSSIRLSKIDIQKLKSQQSILTFDFDDASHNDSSLIKSKSIGSNSIIFPLDEINTDICLLHQKPLDIVCVRDCLRICPSCAIFGQHKAHQMKSLGEIQDIKKKMYKNLRVLLSEKKRVMGKIQGKQLWNGVQKNLERKKKQMIMQIKKRYKILQDMVVKSEKKALSDLEKKCSEYEKKFRKSIQMESEIQKQYQNWEEKAQQKIQILDGPNEEEKFKTLLKPNDIISVGEKFVNILKNKQENFLPDTEKQIEKLTLVFGLDKIVEAVNEFCVIEEYENSFLGIDEVNSIGLSNSLRLNNSLGLNINHSLDLQQQSLLQGQLQNFTKNLKSSQNFTKSKEIVKNSLCSSQSSNQKKHGSFFRTPKNALKVGSINNIASTKSLSGKNGQNYFKAKPKIKLQEKYEKSLSNLLNGTTDTLDLTNAELGDENLENILETIKDKGATVAKLGRNKLSDEGFSRLVPHLQNIVVLNISKNELTQRSLQSILKMRKNGQLANLKSIMLGQNKIQERKNKQKIEEIKSLGINICI